MRRRYAVWSAGSRIGAQAAARAQLICDQHEFMQFWALPVTSPHYAVVGEDGKFSIKDVPAGKYKVVAWHPAINKGTPIEQELEVKDGASASAKFDFK